MGVLPVSGVAGMEKKPVNDDIMEFAIEKEYSDFIFYSTLAQKFQDPGISDICKSLAQEELKHKSALELEVMKNGNIVVLEADKSKSQIKQNMVDIDHLDNMQLNDILELAIDKEEADFRLYAEMATLAPEGEPKETLYALSQEEIKHKLKLQEQLNIITGKNNIEPQE